MEDDARRDRLIQCCITEGEKTAIHLYHYFMRLDLGNFEREAPPRTRWRANLEHAFQEPCAKWMQEMVEDASIIDTLSDGALRDMWNSFRVYPERKDNGAFLGVYQHRQRVSGR